MLLPNDDAVLEQGGTIVYGIMNHYLARQSPVNVSGYPDSGHPALNI